MIFLYMHTYACMCDSIHAPFTSHFHPSHLSPLIFTPLTFHLSPLTSHLSPLTSHLSGPSHISPLTSHPSHFSPHTSHHSPLTPRPHHPPLTSHLSGPSHISPLTSHPSHFSPHTSHHNHSPLTPRSHHPPLTSHEKPPERTKHHMHSSIKTICTAATQYTHNVILIVFDPKLRGKIFDIGGPLSFISTFRKTKLVSSHAPEMLFHMQIPQSDILY